MAIYVHIADQQHATAIRRKGLKLSKAALKTVQGQDVPYGVFAMPVTSKFLVTHQWLRELKQRGFRVAVGVYFHMDDGESVWGGYFNEAKARMTALQAMRYLQNKQPFRFEAMIPRPIPADDVLSVRSLPRRRGPRYFLNPGTRGMYCSCAFCLRGQIKPRRLLARVDKGG